MKIRPAGQNWIDTNEKKDHVSLSVADKQLSGCALVARNSVRPAVSSFDAMYKSLVGWLSNNDGVSAKV